MLVAFLVVTFSATGAEAANRYWVGSAGGNVSDTANWAAADPASCTGGGASVPGGSDVAIFDPDCDNNATIDSSWSVAGINIQSGYTGTITQSSGATITVDTSNYTQADGTFTGSNGSSDSITVNGSFSQSNGTFTSTRGDLNIRFDMSLSGGTFTHNSGTVNFVDDNWTQSSTLTCSGSPFNKVVIAKNSGNNAFNINNGASSCTVPLGASPTTNIAVDSTWNGIVTIDSGTWTDSNVWGDGETITLNGTITHNGTGWILNGGLVLGASGTVTYPNGTDISIKKDLNIAVGSWPSGKNVTFYDTNWSQSTTLTCSGSPFNKVIITKDSGNNAFNINNGASSCTVPLGASPTTAIAVDSTWNGIVTIDSGTWTDSNVWGDGEIITLNGTITHNGTGWILNGGLVLGASGTVTYPNGTDISIRKDLNIAVGSWPSGKNVTFYDTNWGQSTTLTCSGSPFNKVIITKDSGNNAFNINNGASSCTVPLGDNPTTAIAVDSTWNGIVTIDSGTWTDTNPSWGYGAMITLNGTITHNGTGWFMDGGLIMNSSSAVVTYNGTAATFEKSLNVSQGSFPSGLDITFTDDSGEDDTTLTCGSVTFNKVIITKDSTGDMTISAGCTVPLGANPTTSLLGGAFTNNGTITVASGTWNIAGDTWGDPLIITNNGLIDHDGDGWINSRGFVNGASGEVQYAGSTMSVAATFNVASGTFPNGKIVTLYDDNYGDDTTLTCGSVTFGGLIITKDSTGDMILGGSCTITGNMSMTAGTLSDPGSTMTLAVQGDFSYSSSGTFGGGNLTLSMEGSGASSVSKSAGTFSSKLNVNKSGAGVAQLSTALTTTGQICTVQQGIFDINGQAFTCGSTFTVEDGGTLRLVGSEAIVTTPTLNTGSTVSYKGDGDASADNFSLQDWTYSNLTVNMTDTNDVLRAYTLNTLSSGLIYYWKFDDGSGSTAADSSGNAKDGTLTNMEPGDWVSDVAPVSFGDSYALDFGGAGDNDYVISTSLGSPPSSITVAAWIKPNSNGGVVFAELGQAGINGAWHDVHMEVETNNSIKACMWAGGLTCVTAGSGITYDTWIHSVMRYDSSITELTGFVNGTEGTPTTATKQNPGTLYYAVAANDGTNGGNGAYFDGKIDEVRVYNRALLDSEISDLADGNDSNATPLASITINGNFLISQGTFGAPATLNVGGNYNNAGGTFSHNDGEVIFTATNAGHTLSGSMTGTSSFYDLTFNGASGAWSFGANAAKVSNNFTITNGTVTAPSTTLTIGKDFANSAGFTHNNGAVVFDTVGNTSAITGATTFYDLTSTTAGKPLRFGANTTFGIAHTLTLTGSSGSKITLDRSGGSGSDRFTFDVASPQTVSYVSVMNSNASTSNIIANSSTNAGNNDDAEGGAHWDFGSLVSGTVYTDEGSTVMTTTPTVRVKVNGAGDYSAAADGSGVYSVPIPSPNAADVVTVYLDGATEKAVAVTRSAGGGVAGLNLYQNRVIVRHEDAGPVTNADLNQYDNACNSGTGDTDIPFCVDLGNLTLSSGAKLLIWTGMSFTPGGSVTTASSSSSADPDGDILVQSSATLNMGVHPLTIGGDFTNLGTLTLTSGQESIFTAASSGHAIDNGTGNFENMVFERGGGWSFNDASNTINGDLTITSGTLTAPSSLTVAGSFKNQGTFTHNSGTLTMTSASAQTTIDPGASSLYNLIFNNASGTWSLNGDMTVVNDLTMTAGTLTGSGNLTVNEGDVIGDGTILLTGSAQYLYGLKSIATGNHTCAVSNSGKAYCWGRASNGQLGDNQEGTDRPTPVRVLAGAATGEDTDGTYLVNIKMITAGAFYHTCAISNSGKTYCWGYDGYGQLGDNQIAVDCLTPVRVLAGAATGEDMDGTYLINIKSIGAGGNHTCAISNSGKTYCWGKASYGKIGDNQSTTDRWTPVLVEDGNATGADTDGTYLINMKSISLNQNHTCAVSNSGKTYCWGYAYYGAIGDNQTNDRTTPVLVEDGEATGTDTDGAYLINIRYVSVGQYHTCAVSNSGKAYCWGRAPYGRLGDDQESTNRTTPVLVHDGVAEGGADSDGTHLINIKSIMTGGAFSCALANSGKVYCWGLASSGQLGDNQTASNRLSPVLVEDGVATGADTDGTNLIKLKSIAAGGSHTCVLSVSGKTYCWGNDDYGQLGNGATTGNQVTPNIVEKGAVTESPALTLSGTGNFAGATIWSFYNATFDGTTTATGSGGMTIESVATINDTKTLNAGSKTWTLSGSGTPFVKTGTFNADTSTFNYTGSSATTVTAATYKNLGVGTTADTDTGVSYTLGGDTTASGNLTISNASSTNGDTLDASSYNLTVNGNTDITSKGALSAPGTGKILTLGGDLTNSGGFSHNSGTVVFNDNTKTSTLAYSAATTFNNFSVTTGGKTIKLDTGEQTNVIGTFILTGPGCTTARVFLASDTAGLQASLNATGSTSLSRIDVRDSNAVTPLTTSNGTADNDNNSGWTLNGVCSTADGSAMHMGIAF